MRRKKSPFPFLPVILTAFLGLFIFLTYSASQQPQVTESNAETVCGDYGTDQYLCGLDPNCDFKPIQGPGVPPGSGLCVAKPIPIQNDTTSQTPGSSGISPWKLITGGSVDCVVGGVPTLKCLEAVFGNIIFAASAFIILVLFIMFVVGAFFYLTSGGNPERVKKAQSTLKFAVIGFILFISAYLILRIISFLFLGGKDSLFIFEIP